MTRVRIEIIFGHNDYSQTMNFDTTDTLATLKARLGAVMVSMMHSDGTEPGVADDTMTLAQLGVTEGTTLHVPHEWITNYDGCR